MYPEAAHRGLSGGKGGGEVSLRCATGCFATFPCALFPRTPNPPSLAHLHLLRTCGALQVRCK